MADTPKWLTDEGIERTMALGEAVADFLIRRSEAKAINREAQVDIGPRLREMIAEIARENERPRSQP